jgi:nitrite reductase/ring-hydroxylating ferredoxin subunit
VSELPADGAVKLFCAENRRIAVFGAAGKYYAVDDECPHGGSSLSEFGRLFSAGVIQCGLHRAQFDLASGAALKGPTRKCLRRFELLYEDNSVIAREMPIGGEAQDSSASTILNDCLIGVKNG